MTTGDRPVRRRFRSEARRARALAPVLRRLGRRIRQLRSAAGLTQELLAERSRLDAKHVQAIEAGRENVTMATLVALSRALRITLSEVLEGV